MRYISALVFLLLGSCAGQTSLFNITIGKAVNSTLEDCKNSEYPYMENKEDSCVVIHTGPATIGYRAVPDDEGYVFFPGDVGSVYFGELDGVVQYIEGNYNVAYKAEVARQLRARFGPPVSVPETWENGLHIKFTETRYSWHRKDAEVLLFREGTDLCRILVWTPKWRHYKTKNHQWIDGTPLSKPLF